MVGNKSKNREKKNRKNSGGRIFNDVSILDKRNNTRFIVKDRETGEIVLDKIFGRTKKQKKR